ncbi:MAG: hypothetical protein ACR2MA_13050 [Egibacteraceae bacterium]
MERAGLSEAPAVLVAVALTALVAALIGAVALRTRGVAFAMVTLAFAEAFSILLLSDRCGCRAARRVCRSSRKACPTCCAVS